MQAGLQVRTDAGNAYGQQYSGRGAVGPPLLAEELRGRIALAALPAERARRGNYSVQGAQGALAVLHPAPADLVNPACLHTREDACQAAWRVNWLGRAARCGCAESRFSHPRAACVLVLFFGSLVNFCACGRAGMRSGCGLTIRSSPTGLVGGGVREGLNSQRGARAARCRRRVFFCGVWCMRTFVFLLLCCHVYVFHVRSHVSWLHVHVHASRSRSGVSGAYPSVQEGGFPRERCGVACCNLRTHLVWLFALACLSLFSVWLRACQRVVCRQESTTLRGPGFCSLVASWVGCFL